MEGNIYQRLLRITEEISTVAKNLSVGVGKSSYKAVGEADVLAAVKPIEIKYGVYSYPYDRRIIESYEMVSKNTYNGQEVEKRNLFVRVETTYRFVNVDKPDEFIEIKSYGDGVDSQDKAPGKAMTYSDKYALLKAYKIQTSEDPDQQESAPLARTSKNISAVKAKALISALQNANVNVSALLEQYKVKAATDLTEEQHSEIMARVQKAKNGGTGQG